MIPSSPQRFVRAQSRGLFLQSAIAYSVKTNCIAIKKCVRRNLDSINRPLPIGLPRGTDRYLQTAAENHAHPAHRLRAKKALPGRAAFAGDRGPLLLALHAFGHHVEPERAGHREDSAQHREVARVLDDPFDHAAVELERMERQALQVVEVAEPRAEIVERNADAEIGELA